MFQLVGEDSLEEAHSPRIESDLFFVSGSSTYNWRDAVEATQLAENGRTKHLATRTVRFLA